MKDISTTNAILLIVGICIALSIANSVLKKIIELLFAPMREELKLLNKEREYADTFERIVLAVTTEEVTMAALAVQTGFLLDQVKRIQREEPTNVFMLKLITQKLKENAELSKKIK